MRDMNCKYCGKPVGLLRKLAGQSFCSDGHQKKFKDEHEALALSRLEESWSKTQAVRVPALQVPPELAEPVVPAPAAAPVAAAPTRPAPAPAPAAVPAAAAPPEGPEATKPYGFIAQVPERPVAYTFGRHVGVEPEVPQPGRPGMPRLAGSVAAADIPLEEQAPPLSPALPLPAGEPGVLAAAPAAAVAWVAPGAPAPQLPAALRTADSRLPAVGSTVGLAAPQAAPMDAAGRAGHGGAIATPPAPVRPLAERAALSLERNWPAGEAALVPAAPESSPVELAVEGERELTASPVLLARTIEGWADWNSPAGVHAWMDSFLATWFPEDHAGRERPLVAAPADPPLAARLRLDLRGPAAHACTPAQQATPREFPPALIRVPAAHRHHWTPRVLRSRTAPVPLSLRVPELAGLPVLEPARISLAGAGA